MTDDLRHYANCRKALGCSLGDVLSVARKRRIAPEDVEAIFENPVTRDEAFVALKDIRLSLDDIGSLAGLTRERVRQILASRNEAKVKPASKVTAKTVEISEARRQRLLRRMATEPELWDTRGKLKSSLLVTELMASEGFNQAQATALIKQVAERSKGFKAKLLIEIHFGVPADQHFAWINDQLQHFTLTHVLERINRTSPVALSLMTLDVYARSIGVRMTPGAPGIARSVDSSHVF